MKILVALFLLFLISEIQAQSISKSKLERYARLDAKAVCKCADKSLSLTLKAQEQRNKRKEPHEDEEGNAILGYPKGSKFNYNICCRAKRGFNLNDLIEILSQKELDKFNRILERELKFRCREFIAGKVGYSKRI